MKLPLLAALCGLALSTGCALHQTADLDLATAHVTADFETYRVQRVGLVPLTGLDLDADQEQVLRSAIFTEFSRGTPYEIVPLDVQDLEEVPGSEPYRRGRYDPRTIIALARRYQLDGVFVTTITDHQFFEPQRLSMQMDLVATETGVAIWNGSIHLDASSPDVRKALRYYCQRVDQSESWEVNLLSPRSFAHFAAHQLARML
jgi:hypothetical protein